MEHFRTKPLLQIRENPKNVTQDVLGRVQNFTRRPDQNSALQRRFSAPVRPTLDPKVKPAAAPPETFSMRNGLRNYPHTPTITRNEPASGIASFISPIMVTIAYQSVIRL